MASWDRSVLLIKGIKDNKRIEALFKDSTDQKTYFLTCPFKAGDHGDSEYESADEHIANSPKHKNTSPDAKTDKQEDTETEKQGDVTEKLDATEKKDDITDNPVDQKDIQEIKTDEPDVETDQQDAKKDDSDVKKDTQDSEAAKPTVSEEKSDDVKNAVVAEKNEDKSDDDDDVISVKDEDDNSDEDFIDDELDEDDDDLGYEGEEEDYREGAGEEPFPGTERQEGDGQETPEVMDDDEDKKNPQYIPKKGMFYEHDDRSDHRTRVLIFFFNIKEGENVWPEFIQKQAFLLPKT